MATLHIEHGITDFATWKQAFDRFAEARQRAGVTGVRIHQPHDDLRYVVLQLDFPTVGAAQGFQKFLETSIWTSPDKSPGLSGVPRARVLVDATA
jgi:hypothetical protein